jgi:hypothetical protein
MTSKYDPRRPLKEASMSDRKPRRSLECDAGPERLCERVGKLAKHKLVEKPE